MNLTATIITIVDTVLDTTSIVTEFPPEYLSDVNSEGIRTQEIIYTTAGVNSTTTITFPTGFIVWGTDYVWSGTLQFPGSSGCITAPLPYSTVDISSNPQIHIFPMGASNTVPTTGSDSQGLSFGVVTGFDASDQWSSTNMWAFPDQPPLTSCYADYNGGPNWAPFNSTNWDTITSTSYVASSSLPGTQGMGTTAHESSRTSAGGSSSTNAKSGSSPTSTTTTELSSTSPTTTSPTTSHSGSSPTIPPGLAIWSLAWSYVFLLV